MDESDEKALFVAAVVHLLTASAQRQAVVTLGTGHWFSSSAIDDLVLH